ncbi:MAG TPA: hypothetical protein VN048_20085 [Verrucomicrobiae bacterium]|jgi:hypothetical protein|nr:hypothetical protein [Verrucomicrobiae bacterium]
MRLICYIFGYVFVFGGLLSVQLKQFDARPVIAESVSERFHQMSEGQSYGPGYVRDAINKAGGEIWEKTAPWFMKPALVMVVGAVLIDIGARRKKSYEQPTGIEPKPN